MLLKQIGRYEIIHRLGRGGMGSLYLARDPGLERNVAIKLLKDDYQDDHEFRERFAREARALARLRHQNIIVVHDFGEHEGRLFMAMEYIDGETLTQRLGRPPRVDLEEGLQLMEHLCAGLSSAHDAGIVHRDIKPDNIMLDRQGVLKLLDFGIARQAHEQTAAMTQPGMMIGTYSYMSPEQLLGRSVDKRSDIFAVGAVLYQVIAGEQAFPGSFGEVYQKILNTGPVPLEERVPGVSPVLAGVVGRALQRDAEERYQSVGEIRRDLERIRLQVAAGIDESALRPATIVRPAGASPSSRREKDSVAKQGLVEDQLRLGHEAFETGDYQKALQYAERAVFVDPLNQDANELTSRSRLAIAARDVAPALDRAKQLLSELRFDEALAATDDASTAIPTDLDAAPLTGQVRRVVDAIRIAREREERILSLLGHARRSLDGGAQETALRAVYEALALDPERDEARALEARAKEDLRQRREREEARQHAHTRLENARTLAGQGRFDEADALLRELVAPSDTVRAAADALTEEVDRLRKRAAADAIVAEARTALVNGQPDHALRILDSLAAGEQTHEAMEVRAAALAEVDRRREAAERAAQRAAEEERERARLARVAAAEMERRRYEQTVVRPAVTTVPPPRPATSAETPAHAAAAPVATASAAAPAPAAARAPVVAPATAPTRGKALLAAGIAVVVLAAGTLFVTLFREPVPPQADVAEQAVPAPAPIGERPAAQPDVPVPADPAGAIRESIRQALQRGDLDLGARLIAENESRFGAAAFEAEARSLATLRVADTQRRQASIQQLIDTAAAERNHAAALALLEKARQVQPTDARVQAEIRRRNDAMVAELGEREAEAQKQRLAAARAAAMATQLAAIDGALQRNDLAGAESLLQAAEREFGLDAVRDRRQRWLDRGTAIRADADRAAAARAEAERAAAARAEAQRLEAERIANARADTERGVSQISNVLAQFAQAYRAKDNTALAVVWPAGPQVFRNEFRSFESVSMEFGECAIEATAPTATAVCPVTIRRVDVRGRDTSETGRRRFTLRNQAGTWRIESMQLQ